MSFRNTLNRLAPAAPAELAEDVKAAIENNAFDDAGIPNAKVAGAAYTSTLAAGTNTGEFDLTLANGIAAGSAGSVIDPITFQAGTNIGLALNGQELTISGSNFAETRVFASTGARNSHATTLWHQGDVAIVSSTSGSTTTTTSYFFKAADQSAAGASTDADWEVLVSPVAALTGAEIITDINGASGSGTVDVAKLNAAVISSADSIGKLSDVALTSAVEGQILALNGSGDWVNTAAPASTTVGATAPTDPTEAGDLWYYTGDSDAGDTARLFVYVSDGTTSDWIAASPSVQLPNAPEAGNAASNYQLQVLADGTVGWQSFEAAALSLTKETGKATVVANQTAYAASSFISTADDSTAFTLVSAVNQVIYNGFALVEGVDYTQDGSTVTLTAATAGALATGDDLILVNTIASLGS